MAPNRRKYADRREALIKAVSKRRKKIKVMANIKGINAKFVDIANVLVR